MFGATFYDLYKARDSLTTDGLAFIAVGFVVSFMVALVVVKWLIRYISVHNFSAFAYYRIIIGLVMIGILLTR